MIRLMLASCLAFCCAGCLQSVAKEAALSNPNIEIRHSIWTGTRIVVGTEFNGEGTLDYEPKTGKVHIDLKVDSRPAPVIAAEADRAERLIDWYKTRAEWSVRSQEVVGENIQAFANAVAVSLAAGGDAAQKVIAAGLPLLAGSRITIPDVGEAVLGTPIAPEIADAPPINEAVLEAVTAPPPCEPLPCVPVPCVLTTMESEPD